MSPMTSRADHRAFHKDQAGPSPRAVVVNNIVAPDLQKLRDQEFTACLTHHFTPVNESEAFEHTIHY